jgi:hypothetical protein
MEMEISMNTTAFTLVEKFESETERGRDAARSDVDIDELVTWPSRAYLARYYGERYGSHERGTVMTAVHLNSELWALRENLAAVRDIPEDALHAIYLALISPRMTDEADDGPM